MPLVYFRVASKMTPMTPLLVFKHMYNPSPLSITWTQWLTSNENKMIKVKRFSSKIRLQKYSDIHYIPSFLFLSPLLLCSKLLQVALRSRVRLFVTPGTAAYRLLRPWYFPGKSTGEGCHFLLQRIFPTQGSNPGLPQCRQMLLYLLSHKGSPK